MPKITKRLLESTKPDPARDVFVWDSETRGFGVRLKPSGVASYIVQTRVEGTRRSMRHKIGRVDLSPGGMAPEEARRRAKKLLQDAADGIDVQAQKREERAKSLSVSKFWLELIEGPVKELAPGTQANWESNFRNWIEPNIGRLSVRNVTTQDILGIRRAMLRGDFRPGTDRKTHFNRVRSQLHRGFKLAELDGLRPRGTNPVTDEVVKFKEQRRQRFLNSDELRRLNDALVSLETDPTTGQRDAKGIMARCVAAIRLLVATGLRHREALHLQWPQVDFQRRVLHLPQTKTGARDMPLNSTALAILKDMHENRVANTLYVFAGAKAKKPIWSLKNIWPSICRRADLQGVRIHDLRHSFASLAVGQGESLFLTGKLLGHATTAMTGRYSHLSDDPIRAASEKIGDTIAAIWAKRDDAEIVPISEAKTNA